MSKKLLTALYCLSISHFALASQDLVTQDPDESDNITATSKSQNSVNQEPQVIKSVKCQDAFRSEVDKNQTLGYLKNSFKPEAYSTNLLAANQEENSSVKDEKTSVDSNSQKKKNLSKKKKSKVAAKVVKNKVKKIEDNAPKAIVASKAAILPSSEEAKPILKDTDSLKANESDAISKTNDAQSIDSFKSDMPKVDSSKLESNKKSASTAGAEVTTSDKQPANISEVPSASLDAAIIASHATTPVILNFSNEDSELTSAHKESMQNIIESLKSDSKATLKLHSFGYVDNKGVAEARRISLQRAIKVRKFLIENEINPNNISVNATEDTLNKGNRVELAIEKNS